MARSKVFRAVRRWLRLARDTEQNLDPVAAEKAREWALSRRSFFLGTMGTAALLPLVSACGDNTKPDEPGPGIAIIGGGIAGMTAAHFLRLGGVQAQVFEASMRIGGRTYTDRETYSDDGQIVELGGELVDSDHLTMQALAAHFGIVLDDLPDATAGLDQDLFYFTNGPFPNPSASIKRTEDELINLFRPVALKMQTALMKTEGTDDASVAEFNRIDAMSIPAWLNDEANLAPSDLIRRLLEVSYIEEFGLEVEQQSAWNLITLIDATPQLTVANGGYFHVFGDSDERYHLHTGSQSIAEHMAAQLTEQINLDHALSKVAKNGDLFDLTFTTSGGDIVVTASHVIYALPFTKLREVDLTAAELSDDKMTVIKELGYGTNAKLMMQFEDRHWETLGSAGSVIGDVGDSPDLSGLGTGLQTVWSTSRGQDGDPGILTNFVGGQRGVDIASGTPESQAMTVLPWLEKIWPGIAAKYVAGSAIRQHWPTYEFNKGSYASYLIGQWSFFGTEGLREGNQHFCGEHTSGDFQGYMEGGAGTGAAAAAEVLDDLEFEYPYTLKQILDMLAELRPVPSTAKAVLRRSAAAARAAKRQRRAG
ncbi:MAG TPA: FAD-dependent oxidoreductase [Kofleriaceae bacterium]|jgi:monoamine oxidase